MTASHFKQTDKRVVLFLQGPPSPFWCELAEEFERAGARTLRVNLSTADWLFWRRKGALSFRGPFSEWPHYLDALIKRESVTDVVYFSDRFPYHAVAQQVARRNGARPMAVEFGYLRPGWLTLETGGMGAWSHFPDTGEAVREIARRCAPQPTKGAETHKTSTELALELLFHLINQYYGWIFPRYRTDRVYGATYEYLHGWYNLMRKRRRLPAANQVLDAAYSGAFEFTLVAMQLQMDYQIRENTFHKDQRVFLRRIIASFAQHAPADQRLLIKYHPLDAGIIDWLRVSRQLADEFGVTRRVHCFNGGDLDRLIAQSKGVIVSNSTVGLISLRALCPTLPLGIAVYDIPGLTHQSGLDTFWSAPQPVDAALLDDFVTALAGAIQVRGSVYDPPGRAIACREIVERVMQGRVNGYGAFVDPPPRLKHKGEKDFAARH